ncbi:hypothetical protein QO010_002169 [Caulobacter ginsengisoli]|uniref:L,D-transpeptidase n=1 Tax=Caulobacter ginsengisoli TaxID=400775 RepID=A0ABU0IQV2_9CAUL|nr:L,D-transpeptidase [Caulobacter ginsengisoli]MDQ0464388.1 hypothetical protein [Caulobacter ginsengisoli]
MRRAPHPLAALLVATTLAMGTPVFAAPAQLAQFGDEAASSNARRVADWVIASGDNGGLPFVIIDKVQARVFVFRADGRLSGASAILLGLAKGDGSVPGIGQRSLASIGPAERTTPAGRFVAALGPDLGPQEVVWIDYDAGVSMHRVVTANRAERRLQRLATASPLDNRISYGCINVPAAFFDKVVGPAFAGTYGVVYILPEVRSLQEVFGLGAPSSGR